MLNNRIITFALAIFLSTILISCSNKKEQSEAQNNSVAANQKEEHVSKRVGMVIGVKPDKVSAYEALHADDNPGVRDLLGKYHMHNFSIFIKHFPDGKYYEFGYYEYTGDNYEKDMADLAKEPRNIAWLKTTDPLQLPLKGEKGWAIMQKVYFNK
jgi:L-rhamnose mutarotase